MTKYSPGGLNLLTPLRIAFDDSGTTDVLFAVNAAGELTITPAGEKTTVIGVFERTSFAAYFWSTQGTAAIAVAGVAVKVSTAASTTSVEAGEFTISTNNRATYTGTKTKKFHVDYNVGITGQNNQRGTFCIAKNDIVISGSKITHKIGTGTDEVAMGSQYIVELAENDYVEMWAANEDGTGDVFVEHGTCVITEI